MRLHNQAYLLAFSSNTVHIGAKWTISFQCFQSYPKKCRKHFWGNQQYHPCSSALSMILIKCKRMFLQKNVSVLYVLYQLNKKYQKSQRFFAGFSFVKSISFFLLKKVAEIWYSVYDCFLINLLKSESLCLILWQDQSNNPVTRIILEPRT